MSEICKNLHSLFNKLNRFSFPFEDSIVPRNGIYILFEKGETAHKGDRIVRVGTHTGNNQLKPRLLQHFINENKDRSIFRKNIGRAILNRDHDLFLEQWQVDLTPRAQKEKFRGKIDMNKQKEVERTVTNYMKENLSFVTLEITEKQKRLDLESKIISAISLCDECKPSVNWLGLYSPVKKIRESGLWLVNGLYKQPLTETEFTELINSTQKYEI